MNNTFQLCFAENIHLDQIYVSQAHATSKEVSGIPIYLLCDSHSTRWFLIVFISYLRFTTYLLQYIVLQR